MNKHAYLIMVHNNYKVLEKCLLLLDAPYNEFYIHVDRKVKDFPLEYFQCLLKHSVIHVYNEINTNWAGFSLVECELFLLQKAFRGEYSFYHLISGADMPLQNKDRIYHFFEQHQGQLFIDFQNDKLQRHYKRYRNRLSKYHFLQEFRKRSSWKVAQEVLTFLAKSLLGVQIVCHIDRLKDQEIFYGSQWFSIPHGFAEYLVGKHAEIERCYRYTQCPDEHVIQMLAMTLDFKDCLYRDLSGQYSNMRFIEWDNDNESHPVTFRLKDMDRLLTSGKCFARKFDEKESYDVVEALYARLKG